MCTVETNHAPVTTTVDFHCRSTSCLHQNMLSAVLARSGALDLDISIKIVQDTRWVSPLYDLAPHLSRAHTLDVETSDHSVDLIPVVRIPELKVRHLYIKGTRASGPLVLPPNAQNSPLETIHYSIPRPLLMSSALTTALRVANFTFSHRVSTRRMQ